MARTEEQLRTDLAAAGHPSSAINTIIALLEHAKSLRIVPGSKSARTIATIDALALLLRDPSAPLPKVGDDAWEGARRGFLVLGDTIRVKADAFEGHKGKTYNGRVGRVVAIRNGQVFLTSTDGIEPPINGDPFRIEDLERRV